MNKISTQVKRQKLFDLFFETSLSSKSLLRTLMAWFIVCVVVSLASYVAFAQFTYNFVWDGIWERRASFINGYINTIGIALVALVLSVVLGFIFGVGQMSRFVPLRVFCKMYVELIRGTPFLVQIFIFFYVFANAMGIDNRIVSGIVILAIFSSAYVAEIVRAGIESIGNTQFETAMSLGLSSWATFWHVVFPQLIARILPPLAGQLASLIKDSSLLSVISIREFALAAKEVNAATFATLESYFPLAFGYLLLTLPISLMSKHLEKRFKYDL